MIAANVSNTDDWFKQASPAITKFNATELLKDLQSATTVSDQLAMWQRDLNNFDNASLEGINYPAFKKAFESWMAAAKIPDAIKSTLSVDPKTKLPTYVTKYLSLNSNDPASKAAYKEQLIKDFGGLKDSKGVSVISPTLIDEIIEGNQDFSTLVDRVKSATTLAANKELGADAKQIVDITKTDVYKDLIDNPDKLTTSYNKNVAGLTKNATTGVWEVGTSGASGSDLTGAAGTPVGPKKEYDYTGGINQLSTDNKIDPAKMAKMVNSYDTQKGVWSLPSINKDTGLFEANTSPYGTLLTNSLNNYLSKGDYYSPTYVNSLASKQPAAMSSEGIAALKGGFTDPGTSKDLLNLANSVGMDPDTANAVDGITAGSKLSPTLIKTYQLPTTPNTSSAGTQGNGQAKPGVPNLTGARSIAPVTALPTTTPGVLTPPIIKTKEQADIEKAIAAEKLRIEQEKLAKENAEKIKLNSAWYKAGYASADDYSKGMALGYSSGADYYNYLKNLTLVPKSTEKDLTWWGEYNKGLSPEQIKANNAAFSTWTDGQKASVKSAYEASKSMPAWQRAGFSSQEEANTAGKLNIGAEDYYKSQRATGTGSSTVAGGTVWTPELEKLYADHDVAAAKYYKWTPDELAKYLAYGGTNYNFKAYGDEYIPQDASLAALSAPRSNYTNAAVVTPPPQTYAPPAPVTNQGIATGTSNFTTPENMNTNAGGIPTVLPANTQTVTPAAQQAYTETYNQVLANPTDTSWIDSYNKGTTPQQTAVNNTNIATYTPEQKASVAGIQSYLDAMPAWQRAGYVNEADSTAAKSLGVTPDDYYRTHPVQ